MRIRSLLVGLALVGTLVAPAQAQDKKAKIGVLTDQSGMFADMSGSGSVLAVQMAIEDSGLKKKGWQLEVISADHQNKADIGNNIARQWVERDKVDVIMDVPNSAVALAINNIAQQMNVVHLNGGAATVDLSDAKCTPNTIQWGMVDTYAAAHGTAVALTKLGGKKWYFMSADYAFGHAMERDARAAIASAGGTTLGSVKHPINSPDFSSFLLQAQTSKADVIGIANGGGDTINTIKQASEFGIRQGGQKLAAFVLFVSNVHALGLKTAQDLYLTTAFYWDLNDATRSFSKRFQERSSNKAVPTQIQAGAYSGALHYLKAMEAMGGNPHDGAKVVAMMKKTPANDPLFGKVTIRETGRALYPTYLAQVKTPEASKGPWDYYKILATIPADQAFQPLSESKCPLIKK